MEGKDGRSTIEAFVPKQLSTPLFAGMGFCQISRLPACWASGLEVDHSDIFARKLIIPSHRVLWAYYNSQWYPNNQ